MVCPLTFGIHAISECSEAFLSAARSEPQGLFERLKGLTESDGLTYNLVEVAALLTGIDPYKIAAGAELDALIHEHVMGKAGGPFPPYSTDQRAAASVESRLRSRYGTVV